MTREEASDILDDYDVNFDGHTAEEVAEAFDVAFRALEQEPCEDCISRQAACNIVDAIRDCISVEGYWAILERLKKLPSVNPQEPCEDCISRQDLIKAITEKAQIPSIQKNQSTVNGLLGAINIAWDMPSVQPLEQEPCDDCISREEAISTVDMAYDNADTFGEIRDLTKDLLSHLPSVQPTGK